MEAKKVAIEDGLRRFPLCKGEVEKVCLDSGCKYMFLDLDRLVQVGDKVLKYPAGTVISIDEFLSGLFKGEYHIDATQELHDILIQTQHQRDRLEISVRADLNEIETDMNDLCRKIVTKIEGYFKDLIKGLQDIHIKNTQEERTKIKNFEQLLQRKIDHRQSLGRDDFNLSSLHAKFKLFQKEPEKLEGYFQTMIKRKKRYDAFREDKDLQAFQNLFKESTNFEHNIITYLSNSSKLKQQLAKEEGSKDIPVPGGKIPVEERFAEKIVNTIDQTIGTMKHFAIQSAIKRLERPPSDLKETEAGPIQDDNLAGSLSHTFIGKEWNYSSIDSLAKKIEKAEDLETCKIEVNDVLQVGKGKMTKILSQLKRHGSLRVLDISLDRSKLNKIEIDEIVKFVAETKNLIHFGLSLSG